MILSNLEIIKALDAGIFKIDNLVGKDPSKSPFNTSAVDLRLGCQLAIPESAPAAIDLRKPGIAKFLHRNSKQVQISETSPYPLKHGEFLLGQTMEKVDFPISDKGICHSARVEGKSSLARCGIIVHFTAPTIHAGFSGPITLEMTNLGPCDFLLYSGMYICQLIIEQVLGVPSDAPNQFSHQTTPAGTVS